MHMNGDAGHAFAVPITGITAKICGSLAMVLFAMIRNNPDAPAGAWKTATDAAVILEYALGQ